MKAPKFNWKIILAIVIGLALAVLVVVKLKNNKQVAVEKVYHFDKSAPLHVETDTLMSRQLRDQSSYLGTFAPYRETKLSAEIQGKVSNVLVEEGDRVKQGQVLIELDKSLLEHQLAALDVKIEGLLSDVARYTVLDSAGAIQGVKLEKATLGLKAARAEKALLAEKINKSVVRAPFDAVVTAKLTEKGAFAAPGMPLLQLTDLSRLKFTVNLPEEALSLFRENKNYPIRAKVFPEDRFTGTLDMIGSKANRANTFPVRFTLKNSPGQKIKAGMFGTVSTENILGQKLLAIPSFALLGTAERPQVYVVSEGKAHLKEVEVSQHIQNLAIVSSGLRDGDIIVTKGLINLFDGANITTK